MEDIKRVLDRNPSLSVPIVNEGGVEMLVYDSSQQWTLLKLLDDSYLTSLMTNRDYEVNSKREQP